MLTGARALWAVAGLLGYVASYAAPRYMRLYNCSTHPKLGQSAWGRRYGEELRGQLVPLGGGRHIQTVTDQVGPPQAVAHGIVWDLPRVPIRSRRTLEWRVLGRGAAVLRGCRFQDGLTWAFQVALTSCYQAGEASKGWRYYISPEEALRLGERYT